MCIITLLCNRGKAREIIYQISSATVFFSFSFFLCRCYFSIPSLFKQWMSLRFFLLAGTFSNTDFPPVMYAKNAPRRKCVHKKILFYLYVYLFIHMPMIILCFQQKPFNAPKLLFSVFIFSVLLKSWYIWHCRSTPFIWNNIVDWVHCYFIVFKFYLKMVH